MERRLLRPPESANTLPRVSSTQGRATRPRRGTKATTKQHPKGPLQGIGFLGGDAADQEGPRAVIRRPLL
jgi:hypothetical protein